MMIEAAGIAKHYKVHVREPGFAAAMRSLFNRRFTTVKAVDDVSFTIPEGQIVGFLGPNGAGKTTTMKLLTGLLHPTAGRIRVAGFVPFEQKAAFKKTVSLVMGQKSQLMWDVPAAESFLVNKAIYELSDESYRRTLSELDDLLELSAIMKKPVRQLSLGERMKCELAAALLHRPSVIFLDEPTIGLDVNMQDAMRRFIAEYNRSTRATILLTSHYMADVSALCERVMVIGGGKLLYDGSIGELIERHAPAKRIRLTLDEPAREEELAALLAADDRLAEVDGHQVAIETPRERVSSLSALLLSRLRVLDLTVEEPSMESVISRAFAAAGRAEQGGVRT